MRNCAKGSGGRQRAGGGGRADRERAAAADVGAHGERAAELHLAGPALPSGGLGVRADGVASFGVCFRCRLLDLSFG